MEHEENNNEIPIVEHDENNNEIPIVEHVITSDEESDDVQEPVIKLQDDGDSNNSDGLSEFNVETNSLNGIAMGMNCNDSSSETMSNTEINDTLQSDNDRTTDVANK